MLQHKVKIFKFCFDKNHFILKQHTRKTQLTQQLDKQVNNFLRTRTPQVGCVV